MIDAENMNDLEESPSPLNRTRPWLILGLLFTVIAITVLSVISDSWRDNRSIDEVKVYGSLMSSNDEIINSVKDSVVGKYIKDINLASVKAVVSENKFISEVRLNPLFNGEFQIFVTERQPLAIIIDSNGDLKFADEKGFTFPFIQDSSKTDYPVIKGTEGSKNFVKTALLLKKIYNEAPEYSGIVSEIMPGRGYDTFEIISSDYGYRIIIDSKSNLSEQLHKYYVFLSSSICANDKVKIDYLDLRWERRLVIGKLT